MPVNVHALRLKPGMDLKRSVADFAEKNNIKAGWVVSCVGSLTNYVLRFANKQDNNAADGYFEIISLSGTVSANGCHLHLSVADSSGKMTGGHLVVGCFVYTTAEIIIGETKQLEFTREEDGTTPWKELQVKEIEGKV
ncbi:MAG: DNA-binding protein [Chitinophagaceae bacterium]|nr:DNA-binding protein [Chitinophagaceae bacterium]